MVWQLRGTWRQLATAATQLDVFRTKLIGSNCRLIFNPFYLCKKKRALALYASAFCQLDQLASHDLTFTPADLSTSPIIVSQTTKCNVTASNMGRWSPILGG